MKTKILTCNLKSVVLLVLISMVTTISCSSDDSSNDDNPSSSSCDQVLTLSTEFYAAAEAFQNAPSTSTCSALRSEALDFIEAYQSCPELYEDYTDLEEAAQEWTDLDCTTFN